VILNINTQEANTLARAVPHSKQIFCITMIAGKYTTQGDHYEKKSWLRTGQPCSAAMRTGPEASIIDS